MKTKISLALFSMALFLSVQVQAQGNGSDLFVYNDTNCSYQVGVASAPAGGCENYIFTAFTVNPGMNHFASPYSGTWIVGVAFNRSNVGVAGPLSGECMYYPEEGFFTQLSCGGPGSYAVFFQGDNNNPSVLNISGC